MKHQVEILTGFLEIFLLCGLVYAWPVFDHILKKEGVYGELCGELVENGTCQAQNQIYVFFIQIFAFSIFLASRHKRRIAFSFIRMSRRRPFARQV